ncbi:putative ribonuclease H-like domain-containing protein [Tanacetum coccineum]
MVTPAPQDSWSQDKHIALVNIIGNPGAEMLTRAMAKELGATSAHECIFVDFLSEEEPKKVSEALQHPRWVDAMQDKLNQFDINKVWTLVPAPYGKTIIGSKWVFRNKRDETGIVIKNKARLVAQGYNQQEGIDYDETFAPIAKLKAIRIFLAFSTYMNFIVYQMDVKSTFLNIKLKEEVYVKQPLGFESNEFPNHFARGKIDNNLFVYKTQTDVILVQLYVDDIIFGSTSTKLCKQFAKLMTQRYEMSMMGVLIDFLGFQIKQSEGGISINQEKYVKDPLKKYDINGSSVKTPVVPPNKLLPDLNGKAINKTQYRANPKESYLIVLKRIFSSALKNKAIDIRYHFIRDHILKGDIELHFIPTQYQLADIFTKHLDEPTFKILIVELDLGSTSGIRACALRNFDLEVMEFKIAQNNTTAKLLILKLGEYEMWETRIKQYFQVQDYALWEVIENSNSWVSLPQTSQENGTSVTKIFGGNEATKKTHKALLKQQYENFNASSTGSLDFIFNRLQKLVSRLAILGVVITSKDLNSKFLRSLPPEWNTHVVVWMNKADIETMSIDDLYNNFKIVKQDIKKSVGASIGAQNLAFMTASSTSSTKDVNTANPPYEVSIVSSKVNTGSSSVSTTNISNNDVYAFMVKNPNGSNILQQDLEQIHKDDLEAMDLKWQLSLLSMRAKRAPRNKEGQFRNQDNRNWSQDISKRTVNVEDTSSKAILAIDGIGFDWSDMAEEQVQTNMALMAFSDSEVYNDKTCTKTCLKNYETLKKQCDDLIVKLNEIEFKASTYKRGLATVEEQLVTFRKNEVLFSEEIVVLKREVGCKDYEIGLLKTEYEKVKLEKEGIDFKIENFDNASKSLDKLLESQITDKSKKGIGYHAIAPPHHISLNAPTKLDLSYSGLDEFKEPEFNGYGPRETAKAMEWNIAYLSNFKEFVEVMLHLGEEHMVVELLVKLLDENKILLKILKEDNMYSFDMKKIIPKESLTCLVAKATLDESMLWHRRLGHINFKSINKLVKENLVRGLPLKHFENDQTCVACLKRKQHRASCKSKVLNPITKPLFMLYMDLFGPTFVSSLMHKKYCLVVTDDCSREKGIRREYSIARTPQQNGVAERRNGTLIKAARTMLVDSKLPTTFWAEAVSTACYVQNRVLVVKTHNKTPYELFRGFKPALSFMRPFGCHVTILNTLDNLGKFDGKSDEGFFVGYSLSSKAFKVYNTRTRKVEENLHVGFLENKPMIEGNGPKWLFDIDYLTQSMNYVPVVIGTISNESASTQGELNADTSTLKKQVSQDCIVMPIWKDTIYFDSPSKDDSNDEPKSAIDDKREVEDSSNDENDDKDKSEDDSNLKEDNTAEQQVNTASPGLNTGSFELNTASSEDMLGASPSFKATHVEFLSDEDEP